MLNLFINRGRKLQQIAARNATIKRVFENIYDKWKPRQGLKP
jgi:hypothetical protein